jgi:hypothetical protein
MTSEGTEFSASVLRTLQPVKSGKPTQSPFNPHSQVALPDWPLGQGCLEI